MSTFSIDVADVERLQNAMQSYPDRAEKAINSVLHDDGSQIIPENIKRLMPVSGASWRGKAGAAKTSNSLRDEKENLAITVKTQKKYQYLYFPDSGENTRRHAGRQYFFQRGAEASSNALIDRCIVKITESL